MGCTALVWFDMSEPQSRHADISVSDCTLQFAGLCIWGVVSTKLSQATTSYLRDFAYGSKQPMNAKSFQFLSCLTALLGVSISSYFLFVCRALHLAA